MESNKCHIWCPRPIFLKLRVTVNAPSRPVPLPHPVLDVTEPGHPGRTSPWTPLGAEQPRTAGAVGPNAKRGPRPQARHAQSCRAANPARPVPRPGAAAAEQSRAPSSGLRPWDWPRPQHLLLLQRTHVPMCLPTGQARLVQSHDWRIQGNPLNTRMKRFPWLTCPRSRLRLELEPPTPSYPTPKPSLGWGRRRLTCQTERRTVNRSGPGPVSRRERQAATSSSGTAGKHGGARGCSAGVRARVADQRPGRSRGRAPRASPAYLVSPSAPHRCREAGGREE